MNYVNEAKKVFDIEIKALEITRDNLDENFNTILDIITECKGKVIIIGVGKSGHVGRKIAATMASLGTPSFFLHPSEGLHGDLGMITKDDVVIAISYSGESEEIIKIIPNIKLIGAKLIAVSSNINSTLVRYSDYHQILTKSVEACYMNLAPTSSTTAVLVFGDALSIVASKKYNFNKENFALFHPAGSLGKKLLVKVKDLMVVNDLNAFVFNGSTIKDVIIEMGKKGLGIVTIIENDNRILGVITDGDVRRQLEKNMDIYSLSVEEIMTKKPIIIKENDLAIRTLEMMKMKNITNFPVVDNDNRFVGTIRIQDILKAGIII